MADAILGIWSSTGANSVFWFTLAVDDGVTTEPVLLSGTIIVEVETTPGIWQPLTYTVAKSPFGALSLRAVVPAAYRDGTEHVLRATVNGVTYGPWSVRLYS